MYIEEAHATDEWPISSSRFTPDAQIVSVEQPKLASERVLLARRFAQTYGLGSGMKVLVDDPEHGNPFEAAYCECNIVFCETISLMLLITDAQYLPYFSSMATQIVCYREWRHAVYQCTD